MDTPTGYWCLVVIDMVLDSIALFADSISILQVDGAHLLGPGTEFLWGLHAWTRVVANERANQFAVLYLVVT
jgi:hypothetical protein